MKISLYPPLSIHEIGQRPNQEDSIAQWDNRLFVLCDGMGGHEKGEVASQTVCQSLVKWFGENIKDDPFTDAQLCDSLEYAYTELDKYDDGSPRKMGTTLTLLYIHNKGVTAAHIGDSRIYHIRNDQGVGIFYVSRDHSLAFDLFQSGEITYGEMQNFPQKNIVTRAITPGKDNRVRPDVIHITNIKRGDWFVLCSDGIMENFNIPSFCQSLRSHFPHETDEEICQRLISATSKNQDNHSAWLIHVEYAIPDEGDEMLPDEEPIARCNALNIIRQRREEDNDDVVIVQQVAKTKSLLQRMKEVVDVIMNKKN